MRLDELIRSIQNPLRVSGDTGLEISALYYDSRKVKEKGLFFALRGVADDGHLFIDKAVNSGAIALVLEDVSFAPPGVPFIQVPDARRAMASMAAAFYGYPSDAIPLIGITGTNGKTTTTYLIEAILGEAGIPAAVLGTIHYRFAETILPSDHTTPESVELQKTLREMSDLGAKSIVMEVSSHALEQHRVDGCLFDIAVFTNLTRDHLDYHKDMESYLACKKRLFTELLTADQQKPKRHAVVNIDDPLGDLIARAANCPVITYGLVNDADVGARETIFSTSGISGILTTPGGEIDFNSRLLGRFNLYNILAASGVAVAMNIPLTAIRSGIAGHEKVAGRLEKVENNRGVTLLVDYAHTDDALENVLKTLLEISERKIITVFGCGGDRDRGKRPIMGEIAARYSDLSIVTSDNPRTEDPLLIMDQIRAGVVPLELKEYTVKELSGGLTEKGYVMVSSRREAIQLAVKVAQPGDIVLLAGKGHEGYQIIGTEKIEFDDREEAVNAFRECSDMIMKKGPA
ncbi:MAG: UDP-N-acetylmuramoyl-L-alanyl-D-glutamate--2,6-diaminopimelate ligase [Deltaproteobacteria bacterium]